MTTRLGIATIAASAAIAACTLQGDAAPRPGEPFALASLPSLSGGASIALRGDRPVLVNIWATWCGPCRAEMASLEALRAFAPAGVRVVGVSADRDRFLAQEYVRRQRIAFDNAHDAGGARSRERLGVTRFPTTFLVDARGIVRLRIEGARDWSSPEALGRISAALADAP